MSRLCTVLMLFPSFNPFCMPSLKFMASFPVIIISTTVFEMSFPLPPHSSQTAFALESSTLKPA